MLPARNPEIDLARRLKVGDVQAFEPFVKAFHSKLFNYSLMTCGQWEDAEEVAQETLMKVFEHFDQLQDPANVKAWVFRIARNICLTKRRKSAFAPSEEISIDQVRPSFVGDGASRALEIADWSALPDEQAISDETHEMVRGAIAELPEIYKAVLLLRDVEEMSTADAADALGVSEEVVKTRLHRARLAVRHTLDTRMRRRSAA